MVATRSKAYGQTVEPDGESLDESLTERRIRWANLIQRQHFQPVIEEVLEAELPNYENSKVIDITQRIALMRDCAIILASAPSIFAAAVNGSLASGLKSDADLQNEYTVIQERARVQPSIYIHLLADDNGISPTPKQYMIIRDFIIDYAAENQPSNHAWPIDNMTPPVVTKAASCEGYLFCGGIQNRHASTHHSLHDTPLRFPPGECGYSKDAHSRLAQHRAHNSSNYIMNLVEDICSYLYQTKRFSQHYRMHQFIIYLIFKPSQAAIAEIFCSGLLQVWVENGGEFNAYPAGRGVATAGKVEGNTCRDHERWVVENSPLVHNMKTQMERAQDWICALGCEGDDLDNAEMEDKSSTISTVGAETYYCGKLELGKRRKGGFEGITKLFKYLPEAWYTRLGFCA